LDFERKEYQFEDDILVHVQWEGAGLKVVVKFMTVFVARREFGLLLAKGCDRIVAMTPCKQTHPLQILAYFSWTAVLFLTREVTMKLAQAGFGDNFWLTLVRAN
jgi:hypothetical protein